MSDIKEKKALDYFHQEVLPVKVIDIRNPQEALAKNLSGERATKVRTMIEAQRVLEGVKPSPNPFRFFSDNAEVTSGMLPPTVKPKRG